MAESQSSFPRAVGLASAFVVANFVIKIGLWIGLSFLPETSLARGLLAGAVPLVLVAAGTLWLVHRRVAPLHPNIDLNFDRSVRPMRLVMVGLGLGAGMLAATLGILLVERWLRLEPVPLSPGRLASLFAELTVIIVLNAAWEEYVFRGWAFSVLSRRFGSHWIGVLLGIGFGLAHLVNPQWTVLSIVSVVAAGWFLSYALMAGRSIALPIGIHVGWNLAQALLTSPRLWHVERHADVFRSGGAAGIEGSGVATVLTLLGFLAMGVFVVRRTKGGGSTTPRPTTHEP